ncbi:MAG: NHLP bacteriocin export ABC transporter permease/ATPase subunit [Clostridiales bacterium]|nr:NHLP bacteriocin export ABC transporter permease/ATPase subunit [Clostridiales bacterium]
MGWFDNQIKSRREADQQLLDDSFVKIAGVVMGQRSAEKFSDERIVTKNAIDEILKYFHYKPTELPASVTSADDQLDYCLRPHGVMRRNIRLTEGWYKDAYGPILGFTKEDGIPVALLPNGLAGYRYMDPKTGKYVKLNRKTEKLIEAEAICFYRPLPQKKLSIPDLLLYMKRCLSLSDIVMVIAAAVSVSLIGLLIPRLTAMLTGPVLKSGRHDALIGIAICMLCVAFSSQLMNSVSNFVGTRLNTKTSLGVQASMMMRIMTLPANFFRKYSAGELRSRSQSVNQLCAILMGMVLSTGLSSVTSLMYITQIFNYTPMLVVPSLLVILVTVVFSTVSTLVQIRINKKIMEQEAKESGMSYSMITGVQKIKLAGAEKRIFAKWLDLYSVGAELTYNPPMFIKVNVVISLAITLISKIILYFLAVKSGIDQSSYFAFSSAYGMLSGAFMSLSGMALSAARIKPILEMAEPFLKAEPETSDNKEIVTSITGGVELDHISFRYDEGLPLVIDDLSLKVRPGEYVAIVGKTGCGKSTLMRLLLGFEKPEKGSVRFDGKDINTLDLPSLRKKIGTVMQDAGLFQGDIYSNIVITAPELTLDAAWEAAEKAGIADDIRAMPMGMNTIIAEGQGGISGGQRQRLMIARAIAPKPKLLMFDEATSALDNKTQKQVSEALDAMGCTRIVIAHRLSTIRHCDRIIVIDGGRIIEDGSYEDLIAKKGYFAELVERQRLDTAD